MQYYKVCDTTWTYPDYGHAINVQLLYIHYMAKSIICVFHTALTIAK